MTLGVGHCEAVACEPKRVEILLTCLRDLQKPIFGLWIGTCTIAIVLSLRNSSEELNELFHMYYQPLLIMLAMFWFWGIAVRIFELMAVKYEACFSQVEQKNLLNSRQAYQASHSLPSRASFIQLCKSMRAQGFSPTNGMLSKQ